VRYLIAVVIAALVGALSFAQTQPTRPSAYATVPTMPSAFATNPLSPCYPSFRDRPLFGDYRVRRDGYFDPTSSCYSGTIYPSYSAVPPFEFPRSQEFKPNLQGANSLNETQAQQRIEARGYSKVSGLKKDNRGIWRADFERWQTRRSHPRFGGKYLF
jgi:hypothetical protein